MNRLFTIASDTTLCEMIKFAQDKLVLVAPGLSKEVATALADRIKLDGGPSVLSVILDIDPEVCRLGFGDIETFDLLGEALKQRNELIQMQKGVRIGLIVADSEILIYSPTPRYIESGSNSESKPNAIRITNSSAQDLAVACGATHDETSVVAQEVGLDFINANIIQQTKVDLEKNPPRKFDLVRLERVFNYSLEFVEFSVEHYKLNTRSVQLPPELLGLFEKNLQDRIRNSFRVFESGTPFCFKVVDPCPLEPKIDLYGKPQPQKVDLSEKWLSAEAARIRKAYLISLGSDAYGNLILKRKKAEFLNEINRLEKLVALYAEKVGESIEEKITETRDALVQDLFPRVKAAPPQQWLNQSVDGKPSDETIRNRLTDQIDHVFQQVDKTFKPKVLTVFKGVNYETITTDKHFQERILAYFGEDETTKLFSEYDASRAEQPKSETAPNRSSQA